MTALQSRSKKNPDLACGVMPPRVVNRPVSLQESTKYRETLRQIWSKNVSLKARFKTTFERRVPRYSAVSLRNSQTQMQAESNNRIPRTEVWVLDT